MKKINIVIGGLALSMLASSAFGVGIHSVDSFAFSDQETPTYVSVSSLAFATEINPDTVTIGTRTGDFNCSVNPLIGNPLTCIAGASALTFTDDPFLVPLTFAVTPYSGLFLTFSGGGFTDNYQFTSASVQKSTPDDDTLTLKFIGTFHDTEGLLEDGTASLILTMSQVGGPNTAFQLGGTFTTPASFQLVPEPGTWALLGSGLIGLGFTLRRRNRQS